MKLLVRSLPPAASLVVAALLVGAGAAAASRVLQEPKTWARLSAQAPKGAVDEALKAAGLADKCTRETLQSAEVQGVACRTAVVSHVVAQRPMSSAADVAAHLAFAAETDALARSIAAYQPVAASPGFDRRKFEAHREACRALVQTYDRVLAAPAPKDKKGADALAAAIKSFPGQGPSSGKPFKRAACGCVQDTLALAPGADASLEESGALQSILTSRGCFLDEDKLRVERRAPGDNLPADAASIAALRSDETRVLDYAKARDVGLERCREKAISGGRVKDAGKLEKCVCGEIKRWRFPARKGKPALEVQLPVVEDRLTVSVEVDAGGSAARCGPLAGPMVAGGT